MDLSPIDNYHRDVINGFKPDNDALVDCICSPDFNREWKIRGKEMELGIYNHRARRLAEAGLFIEPKFLHTAIIMGEPEDAERLFGHDEWLGYLDARLYAQNYGDQPLTVDFMQEIHRRLLYRTNPDKAGQLKAGGNDGYGGLFLYGFFLPLRFTPEQFKSARQNNSLVRFKVEHTDEYNVLAKVHYLPLSQDEMRYELECLCNWYNHRADRSDPVDLAATLQRSFVSLHPMAHDMNGRTSRILMNWSLENQGLPPSILNDFDADILSSQEEWTEAVRAGCQRYRKLAELSRLRSDPLSVFGLEAAQKTFFDLLDGRTIPILEIGKQHDHLTYDALWREIRKKTAEAAN